MHFLPQRPIVAMEHFKSSPHRMIQAARDELTELTWTTCLAVFVFTCVATRVISGLQSRQREQESNGPRISRLAPYWFPWFGHGFSFLWNHVNLFTALRYVLSGIS